MQMGDVNAVLLANPDKRFEILDDTECKSLLMQFGLLAHFKTDFQGPKQQIVTFNQHKTHFILTILITGMEPATENGYMVHCLPKSKFPPSEIAKFMQALGLPLSEVQEMRLIPKSDTGQN